MFFLLNKIQSIKWVYIWAAFLCVQVSPAYAYDPLTKEVLEGLQAQLKAVESVCSQESVSTRLPPLSVAHENFIHQVSILKKFHSYMLEIVKNKCNLNKLRKKERQLVLLMFPTKKESTGGKDLRFSKDPASAPAHLWKVYMRQDWPTLRSSVQSLLKTSRRSSKGCSYVDLFEQYSEARMARAQQNRDLYYQYHQKFMDLFKSTNCTAKVFQASEREWDEFEADNILWMSRLHWQRGEYKQAEALAKKAYTKTLKDKTWDYVLESQQVLFGLIGSETWKSDALAQGLEEGLIHWKSSNPLSKKARDWLRSRAGLARFHQGNWEKAKGHFTSLKDAMGVFWNLKIDLKRGKRKDTLLPYLEALKRYDPLGYHEWEARKLLGLAPKPFRGASDLKGVGLAEKLLAQKPRKTSLSFLGESLDKDQGGFKRVWDLLLAPRLLDLRGDEGLVASLYWSQEKEPHKSLYYLANMSGKAFLEDKTGTLLPLYYPKPFSKEVESAQKECAVGAHVVYAIMRQESVFDPKAVSPQVGALGLVQVMLETGKKVLNNPQLSPDELMTPAINIRAGTCYLKFLLDRYNQNVAFAAAAYNAGEERLDRWLKTRAHSDPHFFLEMIPFTETRVYVQKVMRNYYVYEWIK